jgi:hypothetical protein
MLEFNPRKKLLTIAAVAAVIAAAGASSVYQMTKPTCPVVFEEYYRHTVEVMRRGGADQAKAERIASRMAGPAMDIVMLVNKENGEGYAEAPLGQLYRDCVASPEIAATTEAMSPYTTAELCISGMLKVDMGLRAKAAR